MKRLTVDQTWEQCLAMWKWVSRRCKGKSRFWCVDNICNLKSRWLRDNGSLEDELVSDCFFCEYDAYHADKEINGGCFCPARKIDEYFDCTSNRYSFVASPRLFYAELKRLNKIRLAKKK